MLKGEIKIKTQKINKVNRVNQTHILGHKTKITSQKAN
jgi:hypothetical protein